jgi:hypothetical protein
MKRQHLFLVFGLVTSELYRFDAIYPAGQTASPTKQRTPENLLQKGAIRHKCLFLNCLTGAMILAERVQATVAGVTDSKPFIFWKDF